MDTTITLHRTRDDWLELALGIAWREPRQLTVYASVEAACWCPQDHNMHQVREAEWPVADGTDLVAGFSAGAEMLLGVLDSGPFEPSPWRVRADLPDGPVSEV